MFSKEVLEEKLAIVRKQRDDHFAVYQQALGAIGILEHLLAEKDHLTTDELGMLLGGKVEAIEPV